MKVSRRFPERAQYLHSEDDGGDSEGELDAIAAYEGYYFLEDGVEGYCFEGADGQPVFYHCYDKDGFYFGDGEVSCEDQDVYYTIGKGFASIPKGFATDNITVPKGFGTDIAPKGFSSIPKGFATDIVPKGFDTDIAPKGFSSIPKGFPIINTSVNSTPKSCATIGASVNTTGKGFDTDSTPVDTIWKGFDTDAGCTVPEINGVAGCQHGAYLFADRK